MGFDAIGCSWNSQKCSVLSPSLLYNCCEGSLWAQPAVDISVDWVREEQGTGVLASASESCREACSSHFGPRFCTWPACLSLVNNFMRLLVQVEGCPDSWGNIIDHYKRAIFPIQKGIFWTTKGPDKMAEQKGSPLFLLDWGISLFLPELLCLRLSELVKYQLSWYFWLTGPSPHFSGEPGPITNVLFYVYLTGLVSLENGDLFMLNLSFLKGG